MSRLKRLTVRGFKSIRELEGFELGSLNVLIGANGAGKSNFISLFRMLAEIYEQRLHLFVREQDGPDALLFGGRKRTPQMEVEFYFGLNGYRISLAPFGDQLAFTREETWFNGNHGEFAYPIGTRVHDESRLAKHQHDPVAAYVIKAVTGWRVYHFHDTSIAAPVRQKQAVRDNLRLKPDAGNLAAYLRLLREKHEAHYYRIIETVRLVAPFFGDFVYREDPRERIDLEWHEAGDPDTVWGPRQLSDGTLRFVCLATLLLQPAVLQPSTILLDEPELGLHPYALAVLSDLLRQASDQRQLIVSTQSVELIDRLKPEDVIVVSRKDGASVFERLDAERLSDWLADYALGDLWKMNVIGGRPTR
jgi:predicted ATPase